MSTSFRFFSSMYPLFFFEFANSMIWTVDLRIFVKAVTPKPIENLPISFCDICLNSSHFFLLT